MKSQSISYLDIGRIQLEDEWSGLPLLGVGWRMNPKGIWPLIFLARHNFIEIAFNQLKALRDQAEAAKDLSESDKKNVLISLVRGIHLIEETERLNVETQQSTDFIIGWLLS